MIGKVTTWHMTPEQLAEYVDKHPIVKTEKNRVITFSEIPTAKYKNHQENSMKSRKGVKL